MKDSYEKNIPARCATCAGSDFEFNEDKTYIKCNRCGREYHGGYEELKMLNQEYIQNGINDLASDVLDDLKEDFKKAFKGNKFIKIK